MEALFFGFIHLFEHKNQPLLPRKDFVRRYIRFFLIAFALVVGSLALGTLGYRFFEGMSWLDALLNTAMLLGGMGPVSQLTTTGGKLFASFFALYAGVVFLVVAGILFAPLVHRYMHHFHLDLEEQEEDDSAD